MTQIEVRQSETIYAEFTSVDFALDLMCTYGQSSGSHHKQWVIDQVARILKGTPLIFTKNKWGSVSYKTGEPSKEYLDWVADYCADGEYDYDCGIAP